MLAQNSLAGSNAGGGGSTNYQGDSLPCDLAQTAPADQKRPMCWASPHSEEARTGEGGCLPGDLSLRLLVEPSFRAELTRPVSAPYDRKPGNLAPIADEVKE